MKKILLFISLFAILSLGPGSAGAADPNPATPPTPEKKTDPKKAPKPRTLPFQGKVKAANEAAKTFTIGERVFQVTSETRITKAGKPAIFADIKVGEAIRGSYSTSAEGKIEAHSVTLGPKTAEESTPKKGSKSEPTPKKDVPEPAK